MKKEPAIQSEKALLGALLLEDKLFEEIKDIVCEDDFYSHAHQIIFKSIKEVYNDKKSFDVASVANHATLHDGYLHYLTDECFSTNNIKSHANIIKEYSVQRKLREAALLCCNDEHE